MIKKTISRYIPFKGDVEFCTQHKRLQAKSGKQSEDDGLGKMGRKSPSQC
jgi:hypothetical protein